MLYDWPYPQDQLRRSMFCLMKEVGFGYTELLDMELGEMHKWIEELSDYNQRQNKAYEDAVRRRR